MTQILDRDVHRVGHARAALLGRTRGAGTGELEALGGLSKRMPRTSFLFLFGSAAISGLPPLNGFVGEFLIYLAAFKGLSRGHALAACGAETVPVHESPISLDAAIALGSAPIEACAERLARATIER